MLRGLLALAKVLGKSLIDENNQRIRSELFDPARQSDLVQALLGIDPGIVTTARAIAPEIAAAEGEPHVDEDADPKMRNQGHERNADFSKRVGTALAGH